jgi:hypothetical protein
MGERAGQRTGVTRVALLAVGVFGLVGCTFWTTEESAPSVSGSSQITVATSVAGEMRSVPTVPETSGSVPADPATADSTPPSTELIGDPQPDPDSRDTLPPLPPLPPGTPVDTACDRLAEGRLVEIVEAAAGARATTTPVGDEVCRFAAGPIVAEVHFVTEAAVESDWFRRDGIEPVGRVGGDAVGLAVFVPPGASGSEGYTIALVSRREGIVTAARGVSGSRLLAEDLAIAAASTV